MFTKLPILSSNVAPYVFHKSTNICEKSANACVIICNIGSIAVPQILLNKFVRLSTIFGPHVFILSVKSFQKVVHKLPILDNAKLTLPLMLDHVICIFAYKLLPNDVTSSTKKLNAACIVPTKACTGSEFQISTSTSPNSPNLAFKSSILVDNSSVSFDKAS